MEQAKTGRTPWRSWSDFTAWAQDFSLMQKVMGGFLGVVVLVGLATSLLGTRLARDTIMDRARMELSNDLATAAFVLKTTQENLEAKVRLMSGSEKIREYLAKGDKAGIRNRLAAVALDSRLDYLTVTDENGRVLARAFVPETDGADVSTDPVIASAINGKFASGFTLVPLQRLGTENPALPGRIKNQPDQRGLVLQTAYPMVVGNRVAAVIYGGIVLNDNHQIVDRISARIFRDQLYAQREIGFVTVFQGPDAVSSTLKDDKRMPVPNLKASDEIREAVLVKGESLVDVETQLGDRYLSAAEAIRGVDGKIIGAIQVGLLEKPITSVVDRLVATFIALAMLGVLFMAAISYVLVKWINHPLEQMLHAARRAAEGDLSHEVPVVARDEVGELAASFNLMIRNLAESRSKLEEWGKQLASKVAEQTGELNQAREQVERVKKLASLEKMADGMAHIMAHISDPMVRLPGMDDEAAATSRVLVLDSDEKVLEVCQRILESEGFEVHLTTSVNQALNELEKDFFDVVVADIDMPEMSGKELLTEIKYRQPEVSVILTASFKATEEAVETVKLGAFDYIPKPFGPHQILLMVYTALQSREMLAKTRRQHASQRAETIFQRLPVAIALADDAHRVVYHNRAFIELASMDGHEEVQGKTFNELFGVDPLDKPKDEESSGSRWLELGKVGRTAKLYNFKLPEEDLRVLMLLDITDTVMKDQKADVFRVETINKAQQVIHQQMRVAQEIAGLLGETTAETKAALFELIKLAEEAQGR